MAPLLASLTATVPVSKLRPLCVRHSELTRAALLQDPQVSNAEILAINAPAGYGKSTFAIQWASLPGLPVAWLTCDESDCDALILMSGLMAALKRCSAGFVRPEGGSDLAGAGVLPDRPSAFRTERGDPEHADHVRDR